PGFRNLSTPNHPPALGGQRTRPAPGGVVPVGHAPTVLRVLSLPIEPAPAPGRPVAGPRLRLGTGPRLCAAPARPAPRRAVAALFRSEVAPERRSARKRYVVAAAAAIALLAALAVALAYDRRIATIFVGSAAAAFVALRLVAALVMAAARRAPRARSTILRLAIANIHPPGALPPPVVLSLRPGLARFVPP